MPSVPATIVPGYQVASGTNANPRFPGGTLRMQLPFFETLGLDLSGYHLATLNLSIAPARYEVVKPRLTFRSVKWHPTEPAEDFSFFDCNLHLSGCEPVPALIYYPHPETKPEHFQPDDLLEVLAPFIKGISYGMRLVLEVPEEQMWVG
ncbi:hypothetical protein DES53_10451 [Roseimicrobium gellanilyticum]|uniref:Uncharacterized protein n=1 Tax=Roseimicrobium gellanilyticum TaxID=748857 RepID=A0A366HM54_9BACT|nr:hypothetical protein [Roseimicrobium gellanilyticum]RBP44232.1 hypothetical protein DES53_10451 [Roseimicrobium gellanilyticum]